MLSKSYVGPTRTTGLEAGDCTLNDIVPDAGDPTFVDEYRVTLTTGGTFVITMRSTAMDSFLILLDSSSSCANGCDLSQVIDVDNNSGGVLDARIALVLAAGTYIIGANSFDVASGSYTLETGLF